MDAPTSTPFEPATSAIANAWDAYRASCFIRPGPALVWVWSAAHEFDLAPAGLHLDRLPGARLELGTHALALLLPHLLNPELHEWHLVPLARVTMATLDAIQPSAAADLRQQVKQLLDAQQAAQAELNRHVEQAHLWRLLPGSIDGALQ